MPSISWPSRSSLSAAGLALVVLTVIGCDSYTPVCSAAPTEPIVGFVVTTVTGDDGTDADILFCYTLRSTALEDCTGLDEAWADDFEPHQINTFEVSATSTIEPGDFEQFLIRNTGGGILIDNSWDLVELRVAARLEDGGTAMLFETVEMSVNLDAGDTLDSSQCTY